MDTKEQIELDRRVGRSLATGPNRLFVRIDHPNITNEHRYENYQKDLAEFVKRHPICDAIKIARGLEYRNQWLKRFKRQSGLTAFRIGSRGVVPRLKLVSK